MNDEAYQTALETLQLALVRTQAEAMSSGARTVVVLEGRDAAGKDGVIKRMTEHLSTRATRVVSLPKPSDRETGQWWFQRYVAHLPAAGELVIFNRSWYNRAGVERVMGFSSAKQQEEFLRYAPVFEQMLVDSGLKLIKYWLDISKDEQAKRLEARTDDPLKQLKVSDMDAVAHAKWDAYSAARDEMLTRTHTELAPWTCVRADHKRAARLALMAHLARATAPDRIAHEIDPPNPKLLFPFELEAISDGRLAR
ncbi:MAG: polyphosphate kinase 2 [Caulobacteraceae bacterium]